MARRFQATIVFILVILVGIGQPGLRAAQGTPQVASPPTAPPPVPPQEQPIVGFLDTHLHQFGNLGFGGLVVWGAPMDPTLDPNADLDTARARALPSSDYIFTDDAGIGNYLAAWDTSPITSGDAIRCTDNCSPRCPAGSGTPQNACWAVFVHGATGTKDMLNSMAGDFPKGHAVTGYPAMGAPDPYGWPAWDILTVQQAYWEWLKRAHDHGLKMITMFAVNSRILCGAAIHRADFGCLDDNAVTRQIQAAKDLEAYIDARSGGPGQGFYRIVYSGDEARAAIKAGKLAVVLGAEVDHPWGCTVNAASCDPARIRQGVQEWYDLGIRVVYPVHLTDNKFGGAAAYNPLFDFANVILNGSFLDLTGNCLTAADTTLPVQGPGLEWRQTVRDTMEDVEIAVDIAMVAIAADLVFAGGLLTTTVLFPALMAALGPVLAAMPFLEALLPGLGAVLGLALPAGATVFAAVLPIALLLAPPLLDVVPSAPGARSAANCNTRGLTPEGDVLINTLMDYRMIIDVDHTNLPTFDAILQIAEARQYPGIVSGHTGLVGAGLTLAESAATFPSNPLHQSETGRNEYNKTDLMVQRILNVGGTVSLGLHQGGRNLTRDLSPDDGIEFECGESSQAWAQTYLYAVKHLGMNAVGIGSDMNGFLSQPAPRYGPKACGRQPNGLAEHPGDFPAGYDADRAEGRIDYAGLTDFFGNPLPQYTFGDRTFDYNTDGMSHVGLYPDFVADLRAINLTQADLAPLFNSVEAYVFMWERVDDDDAPTVVCGTPADGWYADNVTISCSAWDDGTGLLNYAADSSFTLSTNVPDGAVDANAATGTHPPICDRDGHCTGVISAITGIKIDRQKPGISIITPSVSTYALNSAVLADYSCDDGWGSGLATCAGTVSRGAAIDTTVGTHSFRVDATDLVGNAASATLSYQVTYGVCLMYDPAKPVNGTVPVKIRLCDAAGTNVSSTSLAVTATALDGAPPPPNFSGRSNLGNAFRYDSTLQGYLYNVDTRSLAEGQHSMTFTVAGDPVPHTVSFTVKK